MEDVHIYKDNFLNNINSAFFAIYDGYSGKTTALKCSRHLHVYLKEELDSIVTKRQTRGRRKKRSPQPSVLLLQKLRSCYLCQKRSGRKVDGVVAQQSHAF